LLIFVQTVTAISLTTCQLNYMLVLPGIVSTCMSILVVFCRQYAVTKTKIWSCFSSVEISVIDLKL